MATGPTATSMPDSALSQPQHSSRSEIKHSWYDLHCTVKATRRLQTTLSNRVPSEFTFQTVQTVEGVRTRLYFLGVPPGNRENTLLYSDLPDDAGLAADTVPVEQLPWNPLLVPFRGLNHMGFSKEEQLLRERKRLGMYGITTYEFDPESGKFLFPANGSLFTCHDPMLTNQPVFPREVVSQCQGVRMDPKFCPFNSGLVSFINNSDLWVTNTNTGEEKRLTFAHKGLQNIAKDPKSAGVATYIVQEEFDRYTGYWWQPQPTDLVPGTGKTTFRILYEEVDESEVEILHIVNSSYGEHGVDDYRYPRSGTTNSKVILKLVEFSVDTEGKIVDVTDKQLSEPLTKHFPWLEYIVRVGWTPDGNNMWAQLLNRNQQSTAVILIPLQSFLPVCSDAEMRESSDGSESLIRVLYEEHSDLWINVHDAIHFFPQTLPGEISFLWASEATGIRQLYFITSALQQPGAIPGNLKPAILQYKMLTSGKGEVIGQQLWVDEISQLVYYKALHDTPLEEHMYVVSYRNPSPPVRLTELGYNVQTVVLSPDQRYMACVLSSLTTPPFSSIFRLSMMGSQPLGMEAKPVCSLLPASAAPATCIPPELFSYTSAATGEAMYGLLYRPHSTDPSRPHPTVLFVYGGPQIQLVTNSYKGIRLLRLQTLASLGYAVVVVDSRGSSRRGLKFEGVLKNQLGSIEIEDQVEGLHYIAAKTGIIDLTRVAIHGWSYGGYLSLVGLAKKPDVFKLAIAGAPVTCWREYDTGYTERYMDTPLNNPAGYAAGSVLNMARNFPDEENRLLIVHGLIDENVHFVHTSLLVDELIKHCKPYQLQIYPRERHGIRRPEASEHYETQLLSWLQAHL
ncbi:dipeptidyl peptidase 9-like [Acanthaster planci]|uniref:dipeptidyl-peptidase IV n=1 Tax=Acanthaster planci TaxID=133434 RepID=A0A8B7XXK1_ACAPL|nr:dipeptidyl peptidase 9-like [Acanthaster planci]XP_022085604.1 dipeptidyl peptidase 9-like [Acanthaster planci]XP_022085614.1 dipeptidyl peptidase 9-like [Acanthaster planci]